MSVPTLTVLRYIITKVFQNWNIILKKIEKNCKKCYLIFSIIMYKTNKIKIFYNLGLKN